MHRCEEQKSLGGIMACSKKVNRDYVDDHDLRSALISSLSGSLVHEDAFLFSEFPLRIGSSRVDLVLIDGDLKAFEIKSDVDTLKRLPFQIASYNLVFDQVTLLCGKNHLLDAVNIIPDWWGIIVGFKSLFGVTELVSIRQPSSNPCPDNYALSQLLWRDEIEFSISNLIGGQYWSSYSRQALCKELASLSSRDELKAIIISSIKRRQHLRLGEPQLSYGG
jgi:hypothetical protein